MKRRKDKWLRMDTRGKLWVISSKFKSSVIFVGFVINEIYIPQVQYYPPTLICWSWWSSSWSKGLAVGVHSLPQSLHISELLNFNFWSTTPCVWSISQRFYNTKDTLKFAIVDVMFNMNENVIQMLKKQFYWITFF